MSSGYLYWPSRTSPLESKSFQRRAAAFSHLPAYLHLQLAWQTWWHEGMNYTENSHEAPVKHTTPKHPPYHSLPRRSLWVWQIWPNSQGWERRKSFSLFKGSHHQDIFVVMWKTGLRKVLLDGTAGMKNGNCFPLYRVSGKDSKNKKSISAGQHFQWLSWKVVNRWKSHSPTLGSASAKNNYKLSAKALGSIHSTGGKKKSDILASHISQDS